MKKKQYNPPANFSCTNEAIDWLKENTGIRPNGDCKGFPMVMIFIDNERHEFKSHKAAIKLLECCASGCIFKAFRNAGKGLTLQELGK